MDRFQMHFVHCNPNKREKRSSKPSTPKTKPTIDPIGRHFTSQDHKGIDDIKIHILDFIKAKYDSPLAQTLREDLKRKWFHHLQTIAPLGLNMMVTGNW